MTPDDIQGHSFTLVIRGYDIDEVGRFLTDVADEHRRLRDEVEELRRAGTTLAEAERLRAEAEGALARAEERAHAVEVEATSRLRAVARVQEELRKRLTETGEEVELALMALGEAVVDPAGTLDLTSR